MNNRFINQLQALNLAPNEAKVYLALLEIGQTSAGEIIKKTRLHRSVVYETLDKLIERKLAFKLNKQNIAHFQPNDPERILHNIQSQAAIAEDLLPSLRSLREKKSPEITVYEGVESYRRFWIDVMRRMPIGSTNYVAGAIGKPWAEYLGTTTKQYFKIAQERNIGWKLVIFDIDDAQQTFFTKYPNFRWQCRLIEKSVSKEGNFNIFGNESVVLHSATEPMIIEVKNQSLVIVFKNLFDILWESGKKLPK